MTREQAKKLLSAITHFASGGNLWCYDEIKKEWFVLNDNELNWDLTNKACYIIEDQHFISRKAFALGEEIETSSFGELWEKVTDESALWTAKYYRPKPKEPVYEYQWLIRRNRDGYLKTTKHITDTEFICGNEWQVIYKIPESKKVRKCS